jgi:hypothetical protein
MVWAREFGLPDGNGELFYWLRAGVPAPNTRVSYQVVVAESVPVPFETVRDSRPQGFVKVVVGPVLGVV